MRALILDDQVAESIRGVLACALERPIPFECVQAIALGDATNLGRRGECIEIPMGFRCALTAEYQPIGLCLHLSVRLAEVPEGMMPHPEACELLLSLFGFKGGMKACEVYFGPNEPDSIHFVQPVSVHFGESEPV